MPEPDWKTELRNQLDAMAGQHPDLARGEGLRTFVVALVETHRDEAYRYGEMAERSRSGYRNTRRKKKESD